MHNKMEGYSSGALNFYSNQSCNLTINPWCAHFGGRQVFEIIYLVFISVFGSVGNLLVVSSILFKKRLYKHGNIFIVNLALTDFIVTGIHIPTVIANVFKGGNALPETPCMVIGYVVTLTCVCSVCNLTFIALNRYWAVAHPENYDTVFSRKKSYLMVVFIWIWSNLLVTPTLYGWSGLGYDYKMMQCAWNDCQSLAYNIILMGSAIFIPLLIITYCYFKLFQNVRSRGTTIRNYSASVTKQINRHRTLQREVNLVKTLATTVVLFVICWVPYGICILFFTGHVPANVKKIVGWMGLSNSAVNFAVYGIMNRVFRRGYRDFLNYLFCCKSCKTKKLMGTFRGTKTTERNKEGDARQRARNSLFNTQSQNSSNSPSFIARRDNIIAKSNSSDHLALAKSKENISKK